MNICQQLHSVNQVWSNGGLCPCHGYVLSLASHHVPENALGGTGVGEER